MDAVDLPVTADLDDGYDEPGETMRRAIGFGVVGANVEDRLRPFAEAVARVARDVARRGAGGRPLPAQRPHRRVLPAAGPPRRRAHRGRHRARPRRSSTRAPHSCSSPARPPRRRGAARRRASAAARSRCIGLPGALPAAEYEELGVARISYGPLPQRVALPALRDLASGLYGDGVIPEGHPRPELIVRRGG